MVSSKYLPRMKGKMMTANQQPARLDVTRENVIRWVQEAIDNGQEPERAFRHVYDGIDEAGQLDDLASILGANIVSSIWRQYSKRMRPENIKEMYVRVPGEEEVRQLESASPAAPIGPPHGRVIQIKPGDAADPWKAMYPVGTGGAYVRACDLEAVHCRRLARIYKTRALHAAHRSRFFHALAEALSSSGTVKDTFTRNEYMALYERSAPGREKLP